MPAPFRFLDRIDALVGGPASVTTTVRELVRPGGDRPVTRASNALRIPAADVLAHVKEVALGVVQERVRDGLVDALRDHLDEVRAEHEMIEGACPEEGTESFVRDQWRCNMRNAIVASLNDGDIPETLGGAKVSDVVWNEEEGSGSTVKRLADAVIAAPVNDPDAVLARVGLTAAVLDEIVAEIRRKPDSREPWSLERLASSWAFTGETTDAELFREAVTYVLGDPDMIDTGAELLGLAGDEAFLAWARERAAFSDPAQDEADVAEVLRLAKGGDATESARACIQRPETAAGGDEGKPPAAQSIDTSDGRDAENLASVRVRSRTEPPIAADESPLTRAVGAALAVLYDHGCETDKAMAEALGVQKAVVNQSRHGKTPWAPDDAQCAALEAMLARHAEALDVALENLQEVST